MKQKFCKLCKRKFYGRSDKKYCSLECKNEYNNRLRAATIVATQSVDRVLHRNRSILLEIMGKHANQKQISSKLLDDKKFQRHYMTGFFENAQGKRYHVVYDFAWMEFSKGKVLIIRREG